MAAIAWGARADAIDHKETPLTGTYLEYSGELDDTALPKKDDAKVSLTFTGKLARDMFRQLGPSAKIESCVQGEQTRSRGDLTCTSDGKVTECFIGIDMLKGRSINGVIC